MCVGWIGKQIAYESRWNGGNGDAWELGLSLPGLGAARCLTEEPRGGFTERMTLVVRPTKQDRGGPGREGEERNRGMAF